MDLRDLRTLDRRTCFCLNIPSRLVAVLIVPGEHREALARPRSGFLVNAKCCEDEGEGGKNGQDGRIINNSLTLCLSPLLHIIILHYYSISYCYYFYLCIDATSDLFFDCVGLVCHGVIFHFKKIKKYN